MTDNKVYDSGYIKQLIEPVFRENKVRTAYLFGSYAKGMALADSDVDILVDSGLTGLDFVGLIENLREALNKNVDVIDVKYCNQDSALLVEIMQTGVKIYG